MKIVSQKYINSILQRYWLKVPPYSMDDCKKDTNNKINSYSILTAKKKIQKEMLLMKLIRYWGQNKIITVI